MKQFLTFNWNKRITKPRPIYESGNIQYPIAKRIGRGVYAVTMAPKKK
jgi:hypothetical protein